MKKILFTLALVAATATAMAQDGPQFLGPTADSKSPQKNLLREWPSEGPEVKWTVDVGGGYGGPVVRDGRVYLLDRNPEKEIEIIPAVGTGGMTPDVDEWGDVWSDIEL